MSPRRRLYLDRSPGEARGVVTLDGWPERLWLRREGDPTPRLGAVYGGRVTQVSARLGLARIALGAGQAGVLKLRGDASGVCEGQTVRVAVAAEPHGDKPAALRLSQNGGTGEGGLIAPAPDLEALLRSAAPDAGVVQGDEARDVADAAQALALAPRQSFKDGLILTVEPTCALVAVDVDLGEAGGSVSRANLAALVHAARVLRLQALAGLVVIDLIGFPKDRRRLLDAAAEAFAPDGPEVALGGLSRFGALDLSKPHAEQPLADQLLDAAGALAATTVAHRLVRELERQGRAEPGRRLSAACAPDVAAAAQPLVRRLGPRFEVRAELGIPREHPDILAS